MYYSNIWILIFVVVFKPLHRAFTLLNSYFALVMFLFSFFLFHILDLGLGLPLFYSWFKKFCKFRYFCACDNLNKIPPLGLHLLLISCLCFQLCEYVYVEKIISGIHGRNSCNSSTCPTTKSIFLWLCHASPN
jgi:hypothetical protein